MIERMPWGEAGRCSGLRNLADDRPQKAPEASATPASRPRRSM